MQTRRGGATGAWPLWVLASDTADADLVLTPFGEVVAVVYLVGYFVVVIYALYLFFTPWMSKTGNISSLPESQSKNKQLDRIEHKLESLDRKLNWGLGWGILFLFLTR